ncbi:MAG TPA: PLD nuclease N-terminal domain-containing protein [Jatrophihabitantaceae bacterium]
MLFFDGALGLAFLALWIFCIIDVITTPDDKCRNLPKIAWLLIVIMLMDIGSIAWLFAGRTWNGEPRRPLAPARLGATNPDDDEEFLASLRSRAEDQRRRAREAQQAKDEPDRPAEES